jgi:nucleotide-binding universal stress UspA family protein
MSYKTVLAYIPDLDAAPSILDAGRAVATRHGAHLIGLYVTPAMKVHFSGAAYYDAAMVVDLIEKHRARHKQEEASVHKLFSEQIGEAVPLQEWVHAESPLSNPVSTIAAIANIADVIVLPNATGDPSVEPEDYAIADQLLFEVGRPALLVPSGWRGNTLGENVTIAFDGSREAARAVTGGLPLFSGAGRVEVLRIDGQINGETEKETKKSGPNAWLCDNLKRHGVPAVPVDLESGDASIAETIRRHMRAQDADCLVMGAYGHSRMREIVFGGATRDMLRVMPVPVLMSH